MFPYLNFANLLVFLLLNLEEESAVDVWQHTTKSNSSLDEGIQLLISADGKLKMARCDTLDLEVFGGVASQLENFGGEVLQNSGKVDGGLGSNACLLAGDVAEMTLYTTTRELKSGACRVRL